jgi:DNA (cytosine-5)-methyltransferase 1
MKALGVYVFAGLFTRGLVDAGWEIAGVFEDGNFGVKTHRANFPNVPVYTDPATWPVSEYRGRVNLIYGNPPCAGFSLANSEKAVDNQSNQYLINANRVGMEIQPDIFVTESVTNMFVEGDELVKTWEAGWKGIGYQTCRLFENGAALGLPQNRRRALFIASKSGININFNHPRLAPPTVLSAIWDLYDQPKAKEAQPYAVDMLPAEAIVLGSGNVIHPGYAALMRSKTNTVTWNIPDKLTPALEATVPFLPQGKRFEHVSDDIMAKYYWPNLKAPKKEKGRPSLMYRRLEWDKPCAVVTGQGMYFHPDENRLLTIREQCRMMGVPDDFVFDVPRPGEAYREIGKAVSPIVGQWVGRNFLEFLDKPTARDHREVIDVSAKVKPVAHLAHEKSATVG